MASGGTCGSWVSLPFDVGQGVPAFQTYQLSHLHYRTVGGPVCESSGKFSHVLPTVVTRKVRITGLGSMHL